MASSSFGKILGGAMLVSGTCIGAGMLGLPVSTAAGGFYPSAMAFVFCCLMMMISAFYMLEASLWYSGDTNLITMAKSTLGKPGETIAWCAYVLFLYALMTAYTAGAAGLIATFLNKLGIHESWSIWIVVLIFASIVYCGARCVDWVNRLLMAVLIGAYVAMVGHVLPEVSSQQLGDGHAKYLWTVAPLLVTSFGFHLLIPSLKNYLDGDVKALRWSIFLGSLLPLVVYLLWEIVILGVIPVGGEKGLIAMLQNEQLHGKQAVVELTHVLSHQLNNPTVTLFASAFSLCALLTSFIGVALGLFDFFADGFHIHRTTIGKMLLALLTFFPPVLLALYYPRFMVALRYAGIFAAILLVIYPAIMVWRGRYHLKMEASFTMMGGRALILITLLFGLGVIVLEGLHHLDVLPTPIAHETNLLE